MDSLVIFNLIVDVVLRKVQEEENFGLSEMCFYADDRLLEHTDPVALQRDVDRVVVLFSKFGLRANKDKTKFMVVRGAQISMAQDAQTYNRVRMGGISRNQWRKEMVTCSRFGVDVTRGSMRRHLELVHRVQELVFQCPIVGEVEAESRTVRMNRDKKFTPCPVVGYLGGACDSFAMFRHFGYRYPSATLTVDDRTWEKCALCGMQTAIPDRHWKSDTCKKLQVRRSNEKVTLKQWEAESVEFTINGEKIERVEEFRYLGRILTEDDDDSRCIEDQLNRARSRWWRMAKLLKREGANLFQIGRFYMAVVQAVLLYGSES